VNSSQAYFYQVKEPQARKRLLSQYNLMALNKKTRTRKPEIQVVKQQRTVVFNKLGNLQTAR